MFSNNQPHPQTQASKDSLPEWNTVSLKKCLMYRDCDVGQVLMDHYIIFVAHEEGPDTSYFREEPKLLAFDLRDESVQEIKLDRSMFPENLKGFTFTKYKDNQIIRFGGIQDENKKQVPTFGTTIRITIESFKRIFNRFLHLISFQALTVKCEEININGEEPILRRHTAEIYNDILYVYGGMDEKLNRNPVSDLWSFDLNTFTWKACQSSGEKPEFREMRSGFIDQDNLYIYAGDDFRENTYTKDIFRLNLTSMVWKKLEQTETYLMGRVSSFFEPRLEGTLYEGHLLILGEKRGVEMSQNESLCCWNIKTNSWSKFAIQRCKADLSSKDLFVLDNMLILSGVTYNSGTPTISTLDLNRIQGLSIPEAPEEKRLRSLFLSEEESDIKFKIHDRIIPAHKQILVEKSKYFANLFNSGMVESRQSIIDITDPDYDFNVFQEFLRFLYYGEVKLDQNLAFKLVPFTDKYLQEDLSFRCTNYLKHNLSLKNVYAVLDFAREVNIDHLRKCCVNFLKTNVDLKTIFDLTEYLNKQNNPEFAQENIELRDKALTVITQNYFEISKDPMKPRYYEDFLIKNIAEGTILVLLNFIYGANYKKEKESILPGSLFGNASKNESNSTGMGSIFGNASRTENNSINLMSLFGGTKKNYPEMNERERLNPEVVNLRPALFDFIQAHMRSFKENDVADKFTKEFLVDLVLYVSEKSGYYYQKQLHGEQQQASQ